MSDATKKQNWNIYYFWRVGTFAPPSVRECFPCVVASLTFERPFCWGGLCFLTSGSGIFRCWLWIISCNDGSAWHVCLDSMPSSLSTDQTELSYCLRIETDRSLNRIKLSFIHTPITQRRRQPYLAPFTFSKQWPNFWSGSEGVSLSLSPSSPYHRRGGQVKGEGVTNSCLYLLIRSSMVRAPIVAIKAAALLTRAAKIQYPITELSSFPFCHWEMSLRSGSLLF